MIEKDRNLLKQYDVLKVANVDKLIRKKTHDGKQPFLFYFDFFLYCYNSVDIVNIKVK